MLHDRETRESDAALFNQAVPYALSKVGTPGMVLKDEQLTAIQHVHIIVFVYGQVEIGSYRCHSGSRPAADSVTESIRPGPVCYSTLCPLSRIVSGVRTVTESIC